MSKIFKFIKTLPQHRARLATLVIVVLITGFLGYNFLLQRPQQSRIQSQKVARETIVSSVSASGQITSGSSIPVTTQATGVVSQVFVKNGDRVTVGQKIADLILDQASQQKQISAWSLYLQAKNQIDSAQANLNTLQNTAFVANQKFINDAVARTLATNDPTYIEENATWLAAEANYKNQQGTINQAQIAANSAFLSYQQLSSTITAPISGTITGINLSPGYAIQANSITTTAQKFGSITLSGPTQATVNLSELDVVKVRPGQKATITLDAFPGKSFTGVLASIDTGGTITSGVTSYPAIISLDSAPDNIYPNMAVSTSIIIDIKDNVLAVPNTALQTQNGETTVRILKNGQITFVPVQVGVASDSETEIISGLNEGDEVVTSINNATQTGSSQSPFSGQFRFGGGGGFGGARPGGR